jgi:hypothetical protein
MAIKLRVEQPIALLVVTVAEAIEVAMAPTAAMDRHVRQIVVAILVAVVGLLGVAARGHAGRVVNANRKFPRSGI